MTALNKTPAPRLTVRIWTQKHAYRVSSIQQKQRWPAVRRSPRVSGAPRLPPRDPLSLPVQRQEWQIVQSWFNLDDSLP